MSTVGRKYLLEFVGGHYFEMKKQDVFLLPENLDR